MYTPKKGKRRDLTLREALDEEEADERRRRSAQSVEQAQIQNHLALTQNYIAQTDELGPFSQNSNSGFERHEDFLDVDDLSDVPDYESYNTPAQPGDDDNDDDIQYLGTQDTNILGENSNNSQAHHQSPAQNESNSDSDDLKDIDGLLFLSIPPCLISLSQNLTASQLPLHTAPVMMVLPGKRPINKNVKSLKF